MPAWFLHCRPGFESECAADIQARAMERGISGYCKAKPDAGYVIFTAHQDQADLFAVLSLSELIFTRQWWQILELRNDLPLADRVAPIVAVARVAGKKFCELHLETPDTNAGKQLQKLCSALERHLTAALHTQGLFDTTAPYRLHVVFMSTHAAYIGYAKVNNSSAWRMGIPRLKFPASAPSRSTLKLEEAFLYFMNEQQRADELRTGMHAVDLGAAPGGWSWQLVHRGIHVLAVDNGPMDQGLLDSGLLEHSREDGFKFKPARPVDWLVCDIVEKPARVAGLIAKWLAHGWCRQAIFNLKLPMKKRYQELQVCLALIADQLAQSDCELHLQCKQLYHDREEVTVYARCD